MEHARAEAIPYYPSMTHLFIVHSTVQTALSKETKPDICDTVSQLATLQVGNSRSWNGPNVSKSLNQS